MADAKPATRKQLPQQVSEEEAKCVADARKRIERAKQDRTKHQARIADCYKYALPWRHKFFASDTTPGSNLDEIFDSTAMTVVEDFAADMLNTFTPVRARWCKSTPVETLGAGDQSIIKQNLEQYDNVLFSEMRRSNLYQALQESYLDLAIGTMALSITDIGAAEPLHCEAIPATELLLDRGMYGRIDGLWREWPKMRGEEVGVKWPAAMEPQRDDFKVGSTKEFEICDGVWRDWSTPAKEAWRYVVLLAGRLIVEEKYEGKGSSPLIAARWSRDSTTAQGIGPTYRVLSDVKVLNYVQEKELKALDKAVDPVTSMEDDGVINLDNGIEPGTWLPRAQGSAAPTVIESKAKFDVSFAKREDLVHTIRRAHYQDRPEQPGKTPPSATQWSDEAAERARRMGSPATNLVHELQYPIVNRFAYLLSRRGVLPKIELNGRMIALEPISPLLRAQEQEEVVRMDRFAEMVSARFGPQIANVIIKVPDYATALAEKMGVSADLVNGAAEISAAIKQFAPILGQLGQAGAVAPNPAQPAP